MTEFTNPETVPHKESEGEREQRIASNLGIMAGRLGLALSRDEQVGLARFVIKVEANLTPQQQDAAAEFTAWVVGWLVKGK